jgi:hypothetical protein
VVRGERGPRRHSRGLTDARQTELSSPVVRWLAVTCLIVAACTPTVAPRTTSAPDIQRSKIDIVFSGLVQSSYYRPSGKDLLGAALEALRNEARATGGNAEVATPQFDGSREAFTADFRLFASAAEELAAKNPQLSPRRIAAVTIDAMLKVNPDCHNYYVPGERGGVRGLAAPLAQNRLQSRMLPGNIGYLSWREFDSPLFTAARRALDELLAAGARAWLLDVRDNLGGTGPQEMVSWFVEGGPIWRNVDGDGKMIAATAKTELLLPQAYQLPMAVVINARTYSAAEFLTVGLQQRGRARVFGSKSGGCLGGIMPVTLPDGSRVGITESVSIGPISDAPINNVGITPDVEVRDGDPIETAANYLRSLIR